MGTWEKQYDELNNIPDGMDDFYRHKAIQHSPPEAQAEIARLKAKVEQLQIHVQDAHDGWKIAHDQRNTAWNDAIEAAAEKVKPWTHPEDVKRAILALKR